MSTDEQKAAIGGFLLERNSAKREAALLERQIWDAGSALSKAGTLLARTENAYRSPVALMQTATVILEEFASKGGLEALRKAIADYQAITQRVSELTKSLHDAGAE
ncbi:MAG: hypothetical protein M3O35_13600 [Acidobacteriota bacterium]|nr:hypothetical protein [Acidobacteriota bacterium]